MIRFAKINDIKNITKFIDDYWKKNHILSRNESFFKYQHLQGDEVTYVISEDNKNINAILGFIPYGESKRDLMLALWKAIHTEDPFLGVKLLRYLIDNGDARIVSSVGINKKTIGIYKYLGYFVGKMKHWYRLNNKEEYLIAKIEEKIISEFGLESQYYLEKYRDFDEVENNFDFELYAKSGVKPFKEKSYIKKRYFEHPIYKYDVYGVRDEDNLVKSIIVTRIQECNNSKALRLIDCIGDFSVFKNIVFELDKIIKELDCEYVDIYECGIDENIFIESGWINVEETKNVIPNYFSPYVPANIDIYYFSTDKDVILFNGDGDQDRPS